MSHKIIRSGAVTPPLTVRWTNSDEEWKEQYRFFQRHFTNPADSPDLRRAAEIRKASRGFSMLLERDIPMEDLGVLLSAYTDDGEIVGAISSEIDMPSALNCVDGTVPPEYLHPLIRSSRVLNRIAVSPEYRGSGVGAALIAVCETIHARQGIEWWCGLASSPSSVAFFKACGFVVHHIKAPNGLPAVLVWENYMVPYNIGVQTANACGFQRGIPREAVRPELPEMRPGSEVRIEEYLIHHRAGAPWGRYGYT